MGRRHLTTDVVVQARRVFQDRSEAGRALGEILASYRSNDRVVVLGIARGGVPVASEVVAALNAPLDTFVTSELGVPGHEKFAMGAVASGGTVVLNGDIMRQFDLPTAQVRDVVDQQSRELQRREAAYRGGSPGSVSALPRSQ